MKNRLPTFLPLLAMLSPLVSALKRCGIVDATPDPTYHLIKPCSRSKMTLVGSANTKSLQQCQRYAAGKKALALNYNPSGDFQEEPSCLLFDCPEFREEISLAEDDVYDYYSLYADPMPDSNVSCVPKVGMFKLHREKMNFTAAQDVCAEEGGYLANVLSEAKTNALSGLIATFYSGRGKHLVYVGLHDMDMEGQYVNMKDEPMDCFTWRAWAPNQPRSKYKTEDCVVLTTDRNWKVINCTQQMPFLCELQPRGPYNLCEEEPAYCELGDGPPEIPPVSDEPPLSLDPDDHPDIIEIPIPGVSVNGSDSEIETIDIKNTSDNANTKIKNEKPTGSETETNNGKPDNSTKPEDASENPDTQLTQDNYEQPGSEESIENNSNPFPPENEQSQNSNFSSGSNSQNRPFSNSIDSENANQWGRPTAGNINQNTDNKWRPVSIQGTQNGNQNQNWKPNLIEGNKKPQSNVWQPVLNPSNTNPQNENGSQTSQNSEGGNEMFKPENNKWRPQNGNEEINLWRPNNQESGDPNMNYKPEGHADWRPGSSTNNAPGNGWKPQMGPGSNDFEQNNWNPGNEGPDEHEQNWRPNNNQGDGDLNQFNGNWKPNNVEDGVQDHYSPEWTPQTENRYPNENEWKPQNSQDQFNKNKPDSDNSFPNNWNPNNFGDEGANDHRPGWRPQNMGNRDPNLNSWRPQNLNSEDHNSEIPQNWENRDPNTNGWRPQNFDNEEPNKGRPQNWGSTDPNINGWRPQNFDGKDSNEQRPSWRPLNTENTHPNSNDWRPNQGEERPSDWRPQNIDNKDPNEERPDWRPENLGNRDPNINGWKPQIFDNENPDGDLPGWRPQNFDNKDPNEYTWKPQNGDGQNKFECNEWIPQNYENKRPFSSVDAWKPGESELDQSIRNCNDNKWVPQTGEEENENPETMSQNEHTGNSDKENRPNHHNQNSAQNIQLNNQNQNSGSTMFAENDNESLNINQEGKVGTKKLKGNRPVNDIRDNKGEVGGSGSRNSVQMGQMNNNVMENGTTQNGNSNKNSAIPKLEIKTNGQKQNGTRVLHPNNSNGVTNQQNMFKNGMNFENNKQILFSVNNKTETGTSTANMTTLNNREPKTIHITRRQYQDNADKSFITFAESKTSYKTSKAPLRNGSTLKAEDNSMEQSITNRTKNEDKQDPVTIKVRDPGNKKCRAVTYDPNRN